jgi:hypothetical protein
LGFLYGTHWEWNRRISGSNVAGFVRQRANSGNASKL